jgi:hypothetical protein
MSVRKGIYLVTTDGWYVERLVWLIAGTDVVVSSVLTVLYSPHWIYSILFVGICSVIVALSGFCVVVGICSVIVALSGFCVVGNIVYRFGARPMLSRRRPMEADKTERVYFMQTDKWFLERYIYLFVGVNLTISSFLVKLHSLYWLLFTGFVGTATMVFAFTGYCIMANLLYKFGAEPRLEKGFAVYHSLETGVAERRNPVRNIPRPRRI